MMRISSPSQTLSDFSARSWAMSCTEGSRTKSSSPERIAAIRVDALAIGRYSTVSTLPLNHPSLMPHQSLFFSWSVFTPGWKVTSLKGPVPMALRAEYASSLSR
jgi:hypothetical protein